MNGDRFREALSILRPLAPEQLQGSEQVNILFLFGLATLGAAQLPETPKSERIEYLDEAIAAFHRILVAQPELVRVRLELARAFYVKGNDGLSRKHFERVLAGDPPPAIVANIGRFLTAMRQHRRWSGYFGTTLAPDSNINASSDDNTIYIYGLPFRVEEDSGSQSGLGIALWGGGGYEHPLSRNVRLRAGRSIGRREYEGSEFDQTFLSAHAGPRWFVGNRTEINLSGSARCWWSSGEPHSKALGARVETSHYLSRRVLLRTQASYHQREYDEDDHLNGPTRNFLLTGLWQATPTLRLEASVGLGREETEAERYRNGEQSASLGMSVDLPRDFTVGVNGELRWTNFEGNWIPFTPSGESRRDKTQTLSISMFNRGFTIRGFSPKLVLARERRESNAQLQDYRKSRAELQFVRQL